MKLRPTRRAALAAVSAAVLLSSMAYATAAPGEAGAGLATKSKGPSLVQTGNTGPGGTDLEFFSRTLSAFVDRDGALIEVEVPVERHFAMVGNQTNGAKIVDITAPEQSYEVSALQNCTVGQGDVQVTKDGMLAAIAFQTSGRCETVDGDTVPKGSVIVDLSDVYAPQVVGSAPVAAGAHNNTISPAPTGGTCTSPPPASRRPPPASRSMTWPTLRTRSWYRSGPPRATLRTTSASVTTASARTWLASPSTESSTPPTRRSPSCSRLSPRPAAPRRAD